MLLRVALFAAAFQARLGIGFEKGQKLCVFANIKPLFSDWVYTVSFGYCLVYSSVALGPPLSRRILVVPHVPRRGAQGERDPRCRRRLHRRRVGDDIDGPDQVASSSA